MLYSSARVSTRKPNPKPHSDNHNHQSPTPPPRLPSTSAMNLTHNENPWQQQQTHSEDTPAADLSSTHHGNPPTQIQPTTSNPPWQTRNSKPTAPTYCTTTNHAPDPLRPRFTNHHPIGTRSKGFIAHDKRMRGWFLTNTVFLFFILQNLYCGLGKFERFVIVFVQVMPCFSFSPNLLRFKSNSVDRRSLSAGWFGKMFWAFTIKSSILGS